MYDLTLGASNPIPFVMVDSAGVEVAGLGGTFTVTLSKNGAGFGASAGTKAEIAGGWYLYTATAAECDTLGPLALKITGAGCAQQNLVYNVSSIDDHLDDLAAALAAATSTLTVVSAVDGGLITIYQAVSFQATISGLAIPAAWTKVYWTVKRATSEADTDAILQLVESNPGAGTDGLLRVNGAAGTAANGTLTVNQAAGTVVIDLVMTICDDLALATGLVWSLKALHPTSASTLLATGTVNVLGQATAAVA